MDKHIPMYLDVFATTQSLDCILFNRHRNIGRHRPPDTDLALGAYSNPSYIGLYEISHSSEKKHCFIKMISKGPVTYDVCVKITFWPSF